MGLHVLVIENSRQNKVSAMWNLSKKKIEKKKNLNHFETSSLVSVCLLV